MRSETVSTVLKRNKRGVVPSFDDSQRQLNLRQIVELFNTTAMFGNSISTDTCMKVIRMYFDIMIYWLFEGYIWHFPKNLGTIKIVKKSFDKRKEQSEKQANYFEFKKKLIMDKLGDKYNFDRMGFYYQTVTEGFLKEQGFRYDLSIATKRNLRDKIINEKKDYRYEE